MRWVIEFDIVGLFDNIEHDKLMRLVENHCKEKWVSLYVKRCLKAPVQMLDGTVCEKNSGTPQGGVISPVLANLFMHYGFDNWITGNFQTAHGKDMLMMIDTLCQQKTGRIRT